MSRRLLGPVVAILAMCPALFAQSEPFLGTWEINLAASSVTRGAPPKSESIVNVTEPGGFLSTLTSVGARTSVEIQYCNFDGAFHASEGSDPRELSFTRIDPLTIDQETRRNGTITVHRRFAFSADGKRMTVTASGASGNGTPYTNDTRVYDRKSLTGARHAGDRR